MLDFLLYITATGFTLLGLHLNNYFYLLAFETVQSSIQI